MPKTIPPVVAGEAISMMELSSGSVPSSLQVALKYLYIILVL